MIHRYSPDRLRSLRERALLSQREVERLTGISDSTIAYLETGRHRPQSETLRKLLFIYDLNIRRQERSEQLWGFTEEKPEGPRPIRASEIPPPRRRW
jgi:transcriptional regulator with XRE-family HTH domain